MDATGKPHRIPAEMALYAEKHRVFELMQTLLEALLIYRPADPVEFMIEHLLKDNDEVPRVFVVGPPASGKTTIARWICKHLRASYLCPQDLARQRTLGKSKEALSYLAQQEPIPVELWASLLGERLSAEDCVNLGWVLDGFPETRDQALQLQTKGILPRHVIVLYAPDTVLIERNLGKRVDPYTQEVYHATFDWPIDFMVQRRLKVPEGISEQATASRLLESHRNIPAIVQTYQWNHKAINADQPCVDVFAQALNFVLSRPESNAPFTPRVLLLGPRGSGKSLQAALLAQKYGLVDLCLRELLHEKVAAKTSVGDLIKPFFDSGYPVNDNIVLRVLKDRLSEQDCLAHGWVLHGFPRDVDQASLMMHTGFVPNRVFFLNLPTEVALQRLCQRATDPISGERYHSIFKPPTEAEVNQRLLQNPKDQAGRVEVKVDLYHQQVTELEDFYEDGILLNADQDPYTIFEHIESCLMKPLPIAGQ
ncbi:adenylate kinase 8-like [Sphaerodactylus townsendi]|uniref:adenylate kinase 8-like n=1 Tax=Sphaerodactylus townsendi TaxID=933632 RepID=UPI00202743DA|nr:adenylate kinase 8-like [Sphaerodactylus townsendi]